MSHRRIFDEQRDAHFVTFSCYKRRCYLDLDRTRQAVMGTLDVCLRRANGLCLGFVIMPNHLHVLIWFEELGKLSGFLDLWKTESSKTVKQVMSRFAPHYMLLIPKDDDAIWQTRYYDFNVYSRQKLEEKVNYMHDNPVRWGLVERAVDWGWSSARWYIANRPVGVQIRLPPGIM